MPGSKNNEKKLYYIEQKCDASGAHLSDRGPAWIDLVEVTRTGTTIYSRGLTFTRRRAGPAKSNYYCKENGSYYWISGVKKDGTNRHQFGSGKVEILVDLKLLPEAWQKK